MNQGILNALHEDDSLADVPDDVLLRQIEARVPAYMVKRARARAPIVGAGLAVWAIAALGGSDSGPDAAPSAAMPAAPTVVTTSVPTTTVPSVGPSGAVVSLPPSAVVLPQEPLPVPATAVRPPTGSLPSAQGSPAKSLSIAASGYSSATGGTPLEQAPPKGSLPVTAVGGQHLRRSFVRLAGDGRILRLGLEPTASNTNASSAEIAACVITGAWSPARGVPLSDGPPFDAEQCVTGTLGQDATWSFDLGGLPGGAATADGVMLVPAPGTTATFDIAFVSTALA